MVEYTFAEYIDMIFLYGEARGNGRAARRLYKDRFPQRPTPSHTLFAVITEWPSLPAGMTVVLQGDATLPNWKRP